MWWPTLDGRVHRRPCWARAAVNRPGRRGACACASGGDELRLLQSPLVLARRPCSGCGAGRYPAWRSCTRLALRSSCSLDGVLPQWGTALWTWVYPKRSAYFHGCTWRRWVSPEWRRADLRRAGRCRGRRWTEARAPGRTDPTIAHRRQPLRERRRACRWRWHSWRHHLRAACGAGGGYGDAVRRTTGGCFFYRQFGWHYDGHYCRGACART